MNFRETYSQLKTMGTPQNVKVYKKHGAGDKLFGVSFANLNKIKKKIKIDHPLAEKLWKTGNTDAQTLALMIADPEKLDLRQAESWLKDIKYYMLSNYLGGLVAKTSFAKKAFSKWSKSKKEIFKHCAFDVLATQLKNGVPISKAEAKKILGQIEKEIHSSPNRARNAMNSALIAIGTYVDGMKAEAIKAAKRIGPVEIDHGETNCKTPDAASYIQKAYAHRKKKSKKA